MRKPSTDSRRAPRALALPLLALALLGACSVLPKRAPTSVYEPSPPALSAAADWPTVSWSLLVAKPGASQQVDSERISVRPDAGAVQVYEGARWTDTAPDLLQTILLRGFQDSGRIVGVARPGSGVHGDYSLQSELRSFDSIYEGGTPNAVVEVYARLVHPSDGRVVAAQLFRESEPASGTAVPEVVDAFSRASARMRDRLVGWTLVQGQAHASAQGPKDAPRR